MESIVEVLRQSLEREIGESYRGKDGESKDDFNRRVTKAATLLHQRQNLGDDLPRGNAGKRTRSHVFATWISDAAIGMGLSVNELSDVLKSLFGGGRTAYSSAFRRLKTDPPVPKDLLNVLRLRRPEIEVRFPTALAGGFTLNDFEARLDPSYAPPKALRDLFDEHTAQLTQRARTNRDESHNGHALGVSAVNVADDDQEGGRRLTIMMKPIRYYQADCQRKALGGRLTERAKSTIMEYAQKTPFALPMQVGVTVLVRSSDGRLIVTDRSPHLANAAGPSGGAPGPRFHTSVAEGMVSSKSPRLESGDIAQVSDVADGRPAPLRTLYRGLQEELGMTHRAFSEAGLDSPYDHERDQWENPEKLQKYFSGDLVALILDHQLHEYDFVAFSQSRLEFERIQKMCMNYAHDRETRGISLRSLTPRELRDEIWRRPDDYHYRAGASMLLALNYWRSKG